jgi:hypothetical protein
MDKIQIWKHYFLKKFPNYSYYSYHFKFEKLFRGRPFGSASVNEVENKIQHVKHMWCPPKSRCTRQRCNIKGQPMLYLSSTISTIPLEVGSKRNDLISIIEYQHKKEISPISIVGWNDLMQITYADVSKIIYNHFINASNEIVDIDTKISNIFKSPQGESNKFDIYNITIALTQLYLSQKSIGLMYPSVADGCQSFNLALKPQKVKDILIPKRIGIYKTIEIGSSNFSKLEKISSGIILKEGTIKWKKSASNEILVFTK